MIVCVCVRLYARALLCFRPGTEIIYSSFKRMFQKTIETESPAPVHCHYGSSLDARLPLGTLRRHELLRLPTVL